MGIVWSVLVGTLVSATPLLLAAMGELLRENAGVLDIGIEGEMLFGAFAAVLVDHWTGSAWLGALGGVAGGALAGLLFAYFVLWLRVGSTVVGAVTNIFMLGLTSAGLKLLLNSGNQMVQVRGLPSLGPFRLTTYLAVLAVPAAALLLGRTRLGLLTRAAGHYPRAVHSVGGSVLRLRLWWIVVGAALSGLGGAALSIGYLNTFTDNITAGRGFVALAAVFFGRWQPVPAALGCLLFAFVDALQLQLQIARVGVPSDFLVLLPYAATIVVVALFTGRTGPPRTLGETLEEQP